MENRSLLLLSSVLTFNSKTALNSIFFPVEHGKYLQEMKLAVYWAGGQFSTIKGLCLMFIQVNKNLPRHFHGLFVRFVHVLSPLFTCGEEIAC